LAETSPATVGVTGARFEKMTLDEEIGPEIVIMIPLQYNTVSSP
jgi:hypothetical protein